MLKVGTKRRRTKAQIAAEKAEDAVMKQSNDFLNERLARLETELHLAKSVEKKSKQATDFCN